MYNKHLKIYLGLVLLLRSLRENVAFFKCFFGEYKGMTKLSWYVFKAVFVMNVDVGSSDGFDGVG